MCVCVPPRLCRAQQVADRILPAYDTPTRIPLNIINLATQEAKNPTWNQKWAPGGEGGGWGWGGSSG